MEEDDEIIPLSPPLKADQSRERRQKSYLGGQRKRRRILCLKSKTISSSEFQKSSPAKVDDSLISTSALSTKNDQLIATNPKKLTEVNSVIESSVNIYLDSDDEQNDQENINSLSSPNDFDILSCAKLLEKGNTIQSELSQRIRNNSIRALENPLGLISLTQYVSSHEAKCLSSTNTTSTAHHNAKNEQHISYAAELETQFAVTSTQISTVCNIADEAQELIGANFHFSEWPSDGVTEHQTNVDSSSKLSPKCSTSQAKSIPSTLIANILSDFEVTDFPCKEDDDHQAAITTANENEADEDVIKSTPPLLLVKKHNVRTYSKPKIFTRKLLFDNDSSSFSNSDSEESCDLADEHCVNDIDIDLNASCKILENITNLSMFYSQSQLFDLDGSVHQSHPINFDPKLCDFSCAQTMVASPTDEEKHSVLLDEQSELKANKLFDPTVKISEEYKNDSPVSDVSQRCDELNENDAKPSDIRVEMLTDSNILNGDIHLLDEDDDIFLGLNLPNILSNSKFAKRKFQQIAMPSTSSDMRFKSPLQHSTPSTYRTMYMTEQREMLLPKRLRFDRDSNASIPSLTESSRINTITFKVSADKMPNGFSTARGDVIHMSHMALKQSADIFDETDVEFDNINDLDPESEKAKRMCYSSSAVTGFKTGAGANIKISTNLVQKYKKILNEISTEDENESHADNNEKSILAKSDCVFKTPHHIKSSTSNDRSTNKHNTGFRTAGGGKLKISESALKNSARLFDENFNDFNIASNAKKIPQLANLTKIAVKPFDKLEFEATFLPTSIEHGLKTATGASFEISTDALRKYGNIFSEINKGVLDNFSVDSSKNNINMESPTYISPLETCKTPLNEFINKSSTFATSTPNPKTAADVCINHQHVTPVNSKNRMIREKSNKRITEFLELDDSAYDEMFQDFTVATQRGNMCTRAKQTCLAERFDDVGVSGASTLNETDIVDGIREVIEVPDEIKLQRQQALIRQQADCLKKSYDIRPCPGSLYLQKVFAVQKSLSALTTPLKYTKDELNRIGLTTNMIAVSVENALDFKFDMWLHYPMSVCLNNVEGVDIDDGMKLIMDGNSRVGIDEITSAFLQCPSVDPKLVPDHWISNCLKWIIIKLAGMERSYPHEYGGKCLTPGIVMRQLKYRYEREVDRTERSAIRKIVERDDVAAKRMVLFISRVITENNSEYVLELSDGWYCIRTCVVDAVLKKAIRCGKIQIGTKIFIQGAELVGPEEGCSPLEIPNSTTLKISGNSTRRAKWHTKLGYYKHTWPFSLSLNSINEQGGLISHMAVFILRVYPVVYMVREQKDTGHKTTFRSEKVEKRQNINDDQRNFETIEKLYSDVSIEIEKEYEAKRKSIKAPRRKLCDIDDAEELWEFMEYSNDAASVEMELTPAQKKLANDYYTTFEEMKINTINETVKERLNANKNRPKSTPLLKIRVIDAKMPSPKTATLCIWNANESHECLQENAFFVIRNASASGKRGKDIQISCGKLTSFRQCQLSPLPMHTALRRKLSLLCDINAPEFKPDFNEFDTVGYVFHIEDAAEGESQSAFIADSQRNIVCVKFWCGIRQYAYDEVIQIGHFLAICHLCWQPSKTLNRSGVVQAFANEFTTCTENPKSDAQITALRRLREEFREMGNLQKYLGECHQSISNNALEATTNNNNNKKMSTPLRSENPHMSHASFSATINRSLNNTSILNRTLAEFSPGVGQPVSLIRQKYDRLAACDAPPPIPNIRMGFKSKLGARRQFKSPLMALTEQTVKNQQRHEQKPTVVENQENK